MKFKVVTAAMAVTALALTGCSSAGSTPGKPAADGVLRVATEGTFSPFNYYDEKNELVGFEVDVAEALAKQMDVTLKWETASFDSLLIGLQQDRFDLVIASHSVTPEREKQVEFADPHYCSAGVLASAAGGEAPRVDNLEKKVVAAQVGATYLELVTNETNAMRVDSYPSDAAGLDAMLKGQADVWVADRFIVTEAETSRGIKLVRGDEVAVEKIAMATSKDNAALLKQLNAALAEIQADGTYESISQEWFGEDIRCN